MIQITFIVKKFLGDNGFQNVSVSQPTLSTLQLKNDKRTEYVIGWKSKDLFQSKHLPLSSTYLPNIKHFGHKIGIQLNNTPLVVGQNDATKFVNAYIVYDLENLPKIPLNKFTFNNCWFVAINIVKNSDISKWVYSG